MLCVVKKHSWAMVVPQCTDRSRRGLANADAESRRCRDRAKEAPERPTVTGLDLGAGETHGQHGLGLLGNPFWGVMFLCFKRCIFV